MVLRVDEEKGYIDLSKRYARTEVLCSHSLSFRRVSPEDVEACEIKLNKSKVVHSIIRHVSETTGTLPETLYKVYCVQTCCCGL